MKLRPETEKALAGQHITPEQFIQTLRAVFPYGHEDFLPTLVAQMELHSVKNHDYAAGGHALGNFQRVAAILALYPKLMLSDPRVVALVYALKQLDATMWELNTGRVAKVEGMNGRLDDISVYASIIQCINKEQVRNEDIDRQFGVDLAKEKHIAKGAQVKVEERWPHENPSREIEQARCDYAKYQQYQQEVIRQKMKEAQQVLELNKTQDNKVEVSARGVHKVGGCDQCGVDNTHDGRYREDNPTPRRR